MTRQRDAVLASLGEAKGFASAQELFTTMSAAGQRVGLTTVYRHLQALADDGVIDVLRTASGESVYRLCATAAHHHHLVCRVCGRSVEVEDQAVERWAAQVAKAHGFADVTHQVDVFGVCPNCPRG